MAVPRPNVILLVSHDTGRFMAPYGYPQVSTPAHDQLAREGIRLTNTFCTTPLCSPARAALTSGKFPHQVNVNGLVDRRFNFTFAPGSDHAANLFKNAGYDTLAIGHPHETMNHREIGFDEGRFDGQSMDQGKPAYSVLDAGPHLDDWLQKRDGDNPFYVQMASPETHLSFERFGNQPKTENGVWMPPYLAESDELRNEMALFQGYVERLDRGVGQLLEVLAKHGLTEDTIFISTTDHGIDVPKAKGTFYDPGLEVYFFMRYPRASWPTGQAYHQLMSHVDVLPTLLDLTGIDIPSDVYGRSFRPLLEGQPYEENEAIYAEKTFHDSYDPTRVVRTRKYKYIRYLEYSIFHDMRVASIPRYHMGLEGWQSFRRHDQVELFDLEADPGETTNLAGKPEVAAVEQELKAKLARWMVATNDPLLEGPVATPLYHSHIADLKATLG